MPIEITEDPHLLYAIGRNRYSVEGKFGYNTAVAASEEDVWAEGSTYTGFVTTSGVCALSSASANDTSAGTGARKVMVYGLAASTWALQSEEVTLSGATPVNTTGSYVRVFRLVVTEVGAYGGTNAGKITGAIGGATVATIPAGDGQSQQCVYTTPASTTGYLRQVRLTTETTKPVTFKVKVREAADVTSGSGMAPVRVIATHVGLDLQSMVTLGVYRQIPAKSDVWVSCTGTATSSSVTADLDLILVYDV